MKPVPSHGFRSIVGTANYGALTTSTPSRQEVAPPPHPLPPPSQPNHTSFHVLLSHGHDCRQTRAVVWTASRGALATCDRVSQLSALSGIGIGALAFIRTSLVLRFCLCQKYPITHQPHLYNSRLPQTKAAVGRYFALPTTPTRTGVTPTPVSFHNVMHLARSNVLPIHQTFTLRARQVVGRPFGAYNLPKAPSLASEVGLGAARSFHSSKPPFESSLRMPQFSFVRLPKRAGDFGLRENNQPR